MNAPIATLTRWRRSLERMVSRFVMWRRERRIIKDCGCVTYCPKCKDPLNDQSYWLASNGEGLGTYKCKRCGNVSEWHFGIAPCPVLLYSANALHQPPPADAHK